METVENPYLNKTGDTIRYSVRTMVDGWDIEVVIPKSAPLSDKQAVLFWIREYSRAVRLQHPWWSVVLEPSADRYVLEIRRFDQLLTVEPVEFNYA